MSSVKIYTAVSEDLSPIIQGEGFCTDVVRYSDYAALEAKCAALYAELEDAEKRIVEPVAVPDERVAFETFMEKRFKDCIDRRLVKNGDGEYFAWDMQVAWIVWQERAAMLQVAEPVTDNTSQQFESLSRGDK